MPPKRRKTANGNSLVESTTPQSAQFIVNTRCYPKKFITFFDSIEEQLTDEYWDLIDTWPFKHLLELPVIELQRGFLTELMRLWNPNLHSFSLNNTCIKFSAHDISIIMGLRAKGEVVDLTPKRASQIDSDLLNQFFPNETQITFDDLENVLRRELTEDKKATPQQWMSILTMYLFSSVLFTMSNAIVPMFLWGYVENLDKLWDYAWGVAVFDYMNRQIPDIGQKASSSNSSNPTMVGCSFALLVWFYEHTRPRMVHKANNLYPRFLNWNLETDGKKDTFSSLLSTIDLPNIISSSLTPERTEYWVLESDNALVKSGYGNGPSSETVQSAYMESMTQILRDGQEQWSRVHGVFGCFGTGGPGPISVHQPMQAGKSPGRSARKRGDASSSNDGNEEETDDLETNGDER